MQQYDGQIEWRSAIERPLSYVADEARSADLVVISANRDDLSADPPGRIDPGDLVMHAGRPVLMVPPEADRLVLKSAMVAWRDAREAITVSKYPPPALPISQRPFTTILLIAKHMNAGASGSYFAMVELPSSQG